MARSISLLATKYAPWSISKSACGETCPAQFAHKYIHKTTQKIENSVNKVGTAAHTVLEHRVAGMAEKDAVKIALDKTPLTTNELDDLQALKESIEAFLPRFENFCKREQVVEVLREVEWGFTAELAPTGFFASDVYFRGKLDLGAVTKSGDLVVLDHKSGVAKDIQRDLSKKHQLFSYAVLAAANIKNLQGVRCGIHFLQGPEYLRLQWLDYIPTTVIKGTYTNWLYAHLNNVSENLVEPFKARPHLPWPCNWCEFRVACSAYQEMTGAES